MEFDSDESKSATLGEALRTVGHPQKLARDAGFLDRRLVHDLGISGDDFDDFYAALVAIRPTEKKILAKYVPSELSKDSYQVAQGFGWLGVRFPAYKKWYVGKIRCAPLTMRELYDMLYP